MQVYIQVTDLTDGQVAHFRNVEDLASYMKGKAAQRGASEAEYVFGNSKRVRLDDSLIETIKNWYESNAPKKQPSQDKEEKHPAIEAADAWAKEWESTPLMSKIQKIRQLLESHDSVVKMKTQVEEAIRKTLATKDAEEIIGALRLTPTSQKTLFGRVIRHIDDPNVTLNDIAENILSKQPFDVKADDYLDYVLQQADVNLPWHEQLINAVWGLGEAGEVMNVIKKFYFHPSRTDLYHNYAELRKRVISELGDLAFYQAWIAYLFDVTPGEVMQENVRKLNERHKQAGGFPKPSEHPDFKGSVFDIDYKE